jgi:hypothetical protein
MMLDAGRCPGWAQGSHKPLAVGPIPTPATMTRILVNPGVCRSCGQQTEPYLENRGDHVVTLCEHCGSIFERAIERPRAPCTAEYPARPGREQRSCDWNGCPEPTRWERV